MSGALVPTVRRYRRKVCLVSKPLDVSCVVCGQLNVTLAARVAGVDVGRCRACSASACVPLPTLASESAGVHSILTEEAFTAGILDLKPSRRVRLDALARQRYELYAQNLGKERFSMLEVGCGAAGLATMLVSLGVDYYGLDIDSRPIEAATTRGVKNLRVGDFLTDPLDGPYDVIFMTQVFEHITAPRQLVRRLHASLVSGGLVHVDVPNQGTLAGVPSRLMRGSGNRYGAIDWPHHSIAYTPAALRRIFESHFRVKTFTASPDDELWGQGVARGLVQRAYYLAQRAANSRSLAVVFGTRLNSIR
jgi:SAM-dependent methyltransferase